MDASRSSSDFSCGKAGSYPQKIAGNGRPSREFFGCRRFLAAVVALPPCIARETHLFSASLGRFQTGR